MLSAIKHEGGRLDPVEAKKAYDRIVNETQSYGKGDLLYALVQVISDIVAGKCTGSENFNFLCDNIHSEIIRFSTIKIERKNEEKCH